MSIYLDHHSTTPVDPRVLERMVPYFRETFGNAASINHQFGWRAAEAVDIARKQIADLLHTDPSAVIFTSGATEANNLALKGVLRAARPGSHVVTTAVEHKAVLDPLKRLQRQGYPVTIVGVDREGRVDPAQIAAALRPETALVSVMWANNEVGTIQPIQEIGELCRSRGILFHTDAAQVVGKIPVDLSQVPVDLLSISGHKIYAPQGIGVLVVRQSEPRIRIEPLIEGGGHERRLRSGTLPVPLIVGLGAACEIAGQELPMEAARLAVLAAQLCQQLTGRLGNITFNGPLNSHKSFSGNKLPGNVHVSFEGVDGTTLLSSLKQIAVSSGSACTSADPEPSHVLRAMGVPEKLSIASLRFGLGRDTTSAEVDFAASYVADIVERLRQSASH